MKKASEYTSTAQETTDVGLSFLLLTLLAFTSVSLGQPTYSLVELAEPAGVTRSEATGLNESGIASVQLNFGSTAMPYTWDIASNTVQLLTVPTV